MGQDRVGDIVEMVLLRRIGGGVYFRDGRGLMAWRVVVYVVYML